MQKKAIVQECEKYKAQLEKSGTKYKILSEKTMKMVLFFQEFVVKMWSNQENRVRKQVKNFCEVVAYAMHSSGETSLAVGLSPYKIAKRGAFASKLAGRLFSPFCMACSVHKIFIKKLALIS